MNIYTIQQPEYLTCPFKLNKKIIVVKAKLNGIERNFLLDTGAPDLILNKRYIEQNKITNTDITLKGITGNNNIAFTHLKHFKWETLSIKNKKTTIIDFSHLEKALNIVIHGIIGYKVFRDFTLFVDYKKKQLNLWSDMNKSGFTPLKHIDFIMDKHIVVIDAKIGNLKLNMGLDTGATHNLLNSKYQNKINEQLKLVNKGELHGITSETKNTKLYTLDEMLVNDYAYLNAQFLLMKTNYKKRDGLLGYQFLKARQVAINYPERKLQFIRKKTTAKKVA